MKLGNFLEVILILLVIIIVCLLSYIATGCQHDDCRFSELQCVGQTVQICDADHDWDDVMNCDEVFDIQDRDWVCCETDAGAECLLGEECD